MLYGLTPRTADQVRRLIQDGGHAGGRATTGSAARGTTWVKVTGAAVSGWHPGVVSLDEVGAFVDQAVAVKVASADGSALTAGQRYPCTRTGDDGGVARFRTVPPPAAGLLCEVTVSGAAHTVKRKTYSAGIVDFSGPVTFGNCRSTTGSNLAVGTRVTMDPIPDVAGNYWITPVVAAASAVTGSSTATLDYTVPTGSGTDTGHGVVLPSAGLYALWYQVRAFGVVGTTPYALGTIDCSLYNATTATPLSVAWTALCAQAAGVFISAFTGGMAYYTATGPHDIRIYASQGGGPAWSDCRVGGGDPPALTYLRIG